MTKFSAEVEALQSNLKCGHCRARFTGSIRQAARVKYEGSVVYCSAICRHAELQKKFVVPAPIRGPCPVCKNMFQSKTSKQFCSIKCYTKSAKFATMLASAREKSHSPEAIQRLVNSLRTGKRIPCLNCNKPIYRKRSASNKFCSRICFRSYQAERFDRWVANPESLALPQCYDEFLDQEELSCLVSGCNWHGQGLSMHMNLTHGVPAPEFKRAAGFNLNSGIVARPLAELLSKRPNVGIGLTADTRRGGTTNASTKGYVHQYRSNEGAEHRLKARALAADNPGPVRICGFCEQPFLQSTPFGRAIYCSVICRSESYSQKRKENHDERRPV